MAGYAVVKLLKRLKERWVAVTASLAGVLLALASALELVDIRELLSNFIADERVLGVLVAAITILIKLLPLLTGGEPSE